MSKMKKYIFLKCDMLLKILHFYKKKLIKTYSFQMDAAKSILIENFSMMRKITFTFHFELKLQIISRW